MEFVVLFLVVAGIAWVAWKMRASRANVRASKDAALEKAWHAVLSDPNYPHRRIYEERKREYETRARKESEDA